MSSSIAFSFSHLSERMRLGRDFIARRAEEGALKIIEDFRMEPDNPFPLVNRSEGVWVNFSPEPEKIHLEREKIDSNEEIWVEFSSLPPEPVKPRHGI